MLLGTLAFACVTALGADDPSAVRLWQAPVTLPTYLVDQPERNPIFYQGRKYQGAKGPVYPYPMLDRLTDVRRDVNYQAIWLENRFVRFSILPELGGRIFTGTLAATLLVEYVAGGRPAIRGGTRRSRERRAFRLRRHR